MRYLLEELQLHEDVEQQCWQEDAAPSLQEEVLVVGQLLRQQWLQPQQLLLHEDAARSEDEGQPSFLLEVVLLLGQAEEGQQLLLLVGVVRLQPEDPVAKDCLQAFQSLLNDLNNPQPHSQISLNSKLRVFSNR